MTRKRRRLLWLLVIALVLAGLFWRSRLTGPTVEPGSFLLMPIDGNYVEEPPSDFVGKLLGQPSRSISDVLHALHLAAADSRIAGAIVRVGTLDVGWAKTEDLRDGLRAFKASGKPVYAVLEQEGATSNKEYFLASIADRLYLAPATTAPLVGLAAQYVFLGGVWEKLDIEMHVEKIREYKTMGDMLVNREMSPYHREMANSLLDSIDERFLSAIADARDLERSRVRALVDRALSSGTAFAEEGLSDGVKYVADVRREDAGDAPVVDFEDYQLVDPGAAGIEPKHTLAIVYGEGAIVTGESGNGFLQGPVMGSTTIAEALEDAADNDDAKAIIFRIDSPGGSALASDLIWKATQEAQREKPVIVSMSDVAASGGYYVAAGATRILAQATTLTGSIGIVFAKPNIEGLLNRMGITSETLTRGKYARINDLTASIDEETRRVLLGQMNHLYGEFVDRVASGREMSTDRVDEIGRGRVWTGEQAQANGLVDQTGGLLAAIDAAKEAAGIAAADEVELVYYPRRKTLAEQLAETLASRMASVRSELPWANEWRAALALYPFTEPQPLALMPERVIVR